MMGQDETAHQFATRVMAFQQENFPSPKNIVDYGDPAVAQATDKGDTTLQILRKLGITINFRHTLIDPGIKHIRGLLSSMRSGEPELRFSDACPILIGAFEHGYHYMKFKDGTFGKKPHKDGWWEHAADGIRYLLVSIRVLINAQESDDIANPQKSLELQAWAPAGLG